MSKSRIEARFAQLKAENRAAFVAYVMAGDPDYAWRSCGACQAPAPT